MIGKCGKSMYVADLQGKIPNTPHPSELYSIDDVLVKVARLAATSAAKQSAAHIAYKLMKNTAKDVRGGPELGLLLQNYDL